jgi:hypothetical protein
MVGILDGSLRTAALDLARFVRARGAHGFRHLPDQRFEPFLEAMFLGAGRMMLASSLL